jgi:Zn-dependent M28 family amino/carboxypeptidase
MVRGARWRMRPSVRRALLIVLGMPCVVEGQRAAPSAEVITAAKLRADLTFVAGDGMRGRLTGTPENAITADWIRARFEWLGLRPMGGGGSYFAPFELMDSHLGAVNRLEVNWGPSPVVHGIGADFRPHPLAATGRVAAPLVWAGYGISAPALGHDDLAGDVRGKILLIQEGEPGATDPASPFDGLVTSEYAVPYRKVLSAQQKGAAAVLFVANAAGLGAPPEPFDSLTQFTWPDTPPRLPRYLLASWMQQVRIPVGQISVALATQLLAASGQSLSAMAARAERAAPPLALTGSSVVLHTELTRRTVRERNVVAAIEGADPVLRDEYVIIGAHFDHNGADGAQIFAGADDNGSGTAGLLAIAEAYAQAAARGTRPRRSVLFVAFNAEERGPIMGSWGYVDRPIVPLERTVAMLNMDMIGRSEETPLGGGSRFRGFAVQGPEGNRQAVHLIGYSRTPSLAQVVTDANTFGLDVRQQYDNNVSQLLRRSDHWAFLSSGVPALMFHTGLHPDYHRVEDRPERIEYDKLERIVRLVHATSWSLANADTRPVLSRP